MKPYLLIIKWSKVSGGGKVNERNSLGIYTLDDATIEQGFAFTEARFTNIEGDCGQDFSFSLIENGQSIHIADTDKNTGVVCMIFIVECNGKSYKSRDPQVENEEEV
eukprot:TRINITY_DN201_c0_g1_i1.p1 TRINITY_DN201_c0_g1~~TRINITY_DN201_c0_g1_i1.p1  ORF type:complete len:107 (+),score=12.53 TRINITY_DN201_c0_g1_i1:106-426(+)